MAENSGIEWTDHTFNPWMGCTKVSPACKNCYAERDFAHRYGKVQWGPNGTRKITSDDNWRKPLRWNREAESKGIRFRVFCASLADVFEAWDGEMLDHQGNAHFTLDGDPLRFVRSPDAAGCDMDGYHYTNMDDVRQRLFNLIDSTPNLDWLLLTKRPGNIQRMWRYRVSDYGQDDSQDVKELLKNDDRTKALNYRPNVWLGTSVENQEWADKRIPELLGCRDLAPVLFLSCEPLVGPVDIQAAINLLPWQIGGGDAPLHWVITGGESGPDARPADPDWFRSIRDQCVTAGVPFHFKQWGEWAPFSDSLYERCHKADTHGFSEESVVYRVGKKAAGRLLDGRTHDGVPVVTATKA